MESMNEVVSKRYQVLNAYGQVINESSDSYNAILYYDRMKSANPGSSYQVLDTKTEELLRRE